MFGKVPDPFPIPTFRKSTEANFSAKKLADDDRKYVVRTLATMLCTYVQSPSTTDCELVARSLVATHPFLKQHVRKVCYIVKSSFNCNVPFRNLEKHSYIINAKTSIVHHQEMLNLHLLNDQNVAPLQSTRTHLCHNFVMMSLMKGMLNF